MFVDGAMIGFLIAVDVMVEVDGGLLIGFVIREEVWFVGCIVCVQGGGRAND